MTQEQLFNKIAELATLLKLAAGEKSVDPMKEVKTSGGREGRAPVIFTGSQQAKVAPTTFEQKYGKGGTAYQQAVQGPIRSEFPQSKSVVTPTGMLGTPKPPLVAPQQATMAWGKATYNDYSSEGSFDKAFAKARADKKEKFYFKDSKGKENIFGTQLAKSSPNPSYKGPSPLAGTGGVPNANAIVDSVRRSGIITKVEPKGMTGGAFNEAPKEVFVSTVGSPRFQPSESPSKDAMKYSKSLESQQRSSLAESAFDKMDKSNIFNIHSVPLPLGENNLSMNVGFNKEIHNRYKKQG